VYIKTIHIQRFRSIYDATLHCDSLTALVGANGSGKSTFLLALDVFYIAQYPLDKHDFYNGDTSEPISIAVTYGELSDAEQSAFKDFLDGETLTVTKRVDDTGNGKFGQTYFGFTKQHAAFKALRDLANEAERTKCYNELKSQAIYADLPPARNKDERAAALTQWERDHPEECETTEAQHQFFGDRTGSLTSIDRWSKFLLIPAVRDAAADATDGKGSVISELIDMVVRQLLTDDPEIQTLQQEAETKLSEITQRADLTQLSHELNITMRQLTPNTSVSLGWANVKMRMPTPQVTIEICEDDYPTHISRTGHGVQRSFIITLLQHLAMTNREGPETDAVTPHKPHLILAVEEPELFQHPSRQRHFATILADLANGHIPGVADKTQVMYCTHSPLFVDIDRFENLRIISKQANGKPTIPKQTSIRATTKGQLLLDTRLGHSDLSSTLTTVVNEGFFAHVTVLVEGESDSAALRSFIRHGSKDSVDSSGISIISVGGKPNLYKPLIIFNSFGIKTYLIYDNDSKKAAASSPSLNRKLLRLCNAPEEDWPEGVHENYAVFSPLMECVLQKEAEEHGLEWEALLQECSRHYWNSSAIAFKKISIGVISMDVER